MSSTRETLVPRGQSPWRRGFYWLTAALTCPCHLPIYLAILGGTSVGALLKDNIGLALLGITVIFVFSLARVLKRPGPGETQTKDRPPA